MRKILFFVFLFISATYADAQQVINQNIPAEAYDNLKSKGELKPNVHYIIDPLSIPPTDDVQYIPPPTSVVQSSGCACYIPPDASYSVVPFQGYTPPDYRNDDASSASIPIPFTFCLYGTNYTSCYINNNGNITFDAPYSTFSAVGFPSASYVMVAPFWADVDTRGAASGLVYYKITPTALYVNWVSVGYYSMHTDLFNTFSVVITDGNDPVIGVGNNVAFCYQNMDWTTGDASGGSGGFGGTPATVGCNQGNGVDFVQFGRFDSPGSAYAGPYVVNGNGVSWLDNQSFIFNACNSTNIAPAMAGGQALCDTLDICVGDTLIDTLVFLSPEAGQITTLNANSLSPDFSILNITNGNTAFLIYQLVGNSPGIVDINVNAVDDGVPVQNVNYTITIEINPNNTPQPTILGDTIICPGENSVLYATGGNYDTYQWNTGSVVDSAFANSGGIYTVEVSLNGCKKRDSISVFAFPQPIPLITGDTTICENDSTLLTVSNGPFNQYTWSNTATTASTTVPAGTYTVTVTDNNTCTGSATINVVEVTPALAITSLPAVCGGDSVLMTANPVAGFTTVVWSNGDSGGSSYATSPGQYTVTGTEPGGCTASDTVNIALLPDPTGNIVAPISCENQLSSFSFNNTGGSISNYHWIFGTSNPADTSNLAAPGFIYPNSGPYTISVIITASNGCTDTVSLLSPVHPQPTGSVPNTPICLDETVTFNPTITGDSIISYNWVLAGGNPSSSTIINPTVSYASSGTYPVLLTLTTEYGCTTVVNTSFTVRNNPTANFGIYPICISRFTFDPLVTPNDETVVIDWNLGDGTVLPGMDTSMFNHIYNTSGNYNATLIITDQFGCSDSITQSVFVDDSLFLIMPNVLVQSSTVDNDKIDFEKLYTGFNLCVEYTFSIYNRWGVLVFQTYNDPYNPDVYCDTCFKGFDNNGAELTPGVYFYVLQGNYNVVKSGSITIFD